MGGFDIEHMKSEKFQQLNFEVGERLSGMALDSNDELERRLTAAEFSMLPSSSLRFGFQPFNPERMTVSESSRHTPPVVINISINKF